MPKIIELFSNSKCRHVDCNSLCDVNNTSLTTSGCCIIVYGQCSAGHTFQWQSSDTIVNQTHATMLVRFSTAIVLSGNNYHKIKMFADILGLSIPCSSSFHAHQRHYICPGVNDFYLKEQVNLCGFTVDKTLCKSS